MKLIDILNAVLAKYPDCRRYSKDGVTNIVTQDGIIIGTGITVNEAWSMAYRNAGLGDPFN